MKIAHLTNAFSSNGGVGAYVMRLCRAQHRAGHEIVVIHSDPNAIHEPDFSLHRVDAYAKYRGHDFDENNVEVLKILNREKPDIVHIQANENYSLEDSIRTQFLCVKSIHVYEFCPSGTKYHYLTGKVCSHATGPMCLLRMVYKRCTQAKLPTTLAMFYQRARYDIQNDRKFPKVMVASNFVREAAVQSGYDAKQVELVPYFTEPAKIKTTASEPGLIVFAGRVVKEKGARELIRAVSFLPDHLKWKLVINGDGAELQALKKFAYQSNLDHRIDFLGWADPGKHHELYANASVVVVPSIWPEPFGMVGIEAMSYGKPVIGFAVGGIQDWIHDGKNGFLIPPYDLKKMAEKIQLLIEDTQMAQKMGAYGRELSQTKYGPDSHVQRMDEIYQSVIAAKDNQSVF